MLGTAFRLIVAFACVPFFLFPFVNLIAIPVLGPVFAWALISAARRIWKRAPIETAAEA